jgi:hypothetical protein
MQRVEIHLAGHLDEHWSKWMEGFILVHTDRDETVLTGRVKDQAALYGVIAKLRDLGVQLTAVRIEASEDGALDEGKGNAPAPTTRDGK